MKPIIAITMGDPAGIGAEVTVRALTHRDLYRLVSRLSSAPPKRLQTPTASQTRG